MGRSSRAIVADISVVRTFLVIHPLHKLRDDDVHVRVSFAVRVRRQVQRHIVDENGEVRAVVEIEAAKKILVCLAAAGVLRDDDAGNRLQNFSRTKNRTILDFLCAHRTLGGGFGNSDEVILSALHVDGGAHRAHNQRDAQRGWRPGGPYGDGDFFGFKTGIRYDESITTCWESRNNEGTLSYPTASCFARNHPRFEPALLPLRSLLQTYQRLFRKAETNRPYLCWRPASSSARPRSQSRFALKLPLQRKKLWPKCKIILLVLRTSIWCYWLPQQGPLSKSTRCINVCECETLHS